MEYGSAGNNWLMDPEEIILGFFRVSLPPLSSACYVCQDIYSAKFSILKIVKSAMPVTKLREEFRQLNGLKHPNIASVNYFDILI